MLILIIYFLVRHLQQNVLSHEQHTLSPGPDENLERKLLKPVFVLLHEKNAGIESGCT